jgi:predicted Zn-dependent protease
MAHEIAHVAARHWASQMTKATIAQYAMLPLIFIPMTTAVYYGVMEAYMNGVPLAFLKFSRGAEAEADYLGLQYMYKAGYDPNSYVTFFERIQADEKRRPGSIPRIFSTHPPTPERIDNAQKEIARILPDRDDYIVTTSEFDNVKARLRNVMFARKVQDNGPGKPTLRTKTEQADKQKQGDPNSTNPDDDRPTLKRRPDSPLVTAAPVATAGKGF